MRYWCNGCRRTFNDLTNPLLAQSKQSLSYWILTTFLLCLSCSSRRIARELDVHIRPSYRWCWWLRNATASYETDRHGEGTVAGLFHARYIEKAGKGGSMSALRHFDSNFTIS